MPPPQKKIEFLPENGGFLVHSRITFYVYAKIGQANGGGGCPTRPLAWIRHWSMYVVKKR